MDCDATLLTAHSEKEQASGNYKHGFGFHPLLCYLDNTDETLAGILRPGNAAAHTSRPHHGARWGARTTAATTAPGTTAHPGTCRFSRSNTRFYQRAS